MASQLDGPGTIKMQVLEEALDHLQRLHTIVERMAMSLRNSQGTMQFVPALKRTAIPLVGQLKGQFGPLADQVTTMLLAATRGGSEQMKVRGLREQIGLLRQSIDIQMNKVKEKHSVEQETPPD
jgi:hypothetical protein